MILESICESTSKTISHAKTNTKKQTISHALDFQIIVISKA